MGGAEVVRPYTTGTTFKTVVDRDNLLASHFGFKIVPNGVFLDQQGIIRLEQQGLRVIEPTHVEAVETLIQDSQREITLGDAYHVTDTTNSLEKQLAATKFKLANEYLKQGRTEEALQELDEALLFDPESFLIRKQRWYIRHPERFAPMIDIEWQQQQYEQEKQAEAQRLGHDCGPEGCLLPGYTPPTK